MNNFLKGSNSKFVVNLFKTFGIACSLVAVQACNENPNNSDKNGERGGASGGSDNGQKNGGEQPGDEDMDEHDTDTDDEEGTGSNNDSGSGTGENGGNPGSGSGTGSGNGGGSGTGDGTGKGGSNPGGGDATDADAQKKQKITDKINEISNSTDWNNFTTLVNGFVSDKDLIVEDVFNKIKEKIGGKVYCGSTVLDFKIDDNAKLIEFLKFCESVENVFKKNDDFLKFYFKAGDDVNIFINGANEFNLANLESLVTIENTAGEGLELDDQGKIKLLSGAEWDSQGDINKIVGFLEGISKMNLGTDFKGLDVAESTDDFGFKIGDFAIQLKPAPDENRNIEQVVDCWKSVRAIKDSKSECIGKFFEKLKIFDGNDNTKEASNTSTNFYFFGHNMDFKNFFKSNINLCFDFFNTLFPGNVEIKNEENKIIIIYGDQSLSYSTETTA